MTGTVYSPKGIAGKSSCRWFFDDLRFSWSLNLIDRNSASLLSRVTLPVTWEGLDDILVWHLAPAEKGDSKKAPGILDRMPHALKSNKENKYHTQRLHEEILEYMKSLDADQGEKEWTQYEERLLPHQSSCLAFIATQYFFVWNPFLFKKILLTYSWIMMSALFGSLSLFVFYLENLLDNHKENLSRAPVLALSLIAWFLCGLQLLFTRRNDV